MAEENIQERANRLRQAERALVAADRAGNGQDARKLAEFVERERFNLRNLESEQESPGLLGGVARGAIGAGETGLSFGTGAVTEPVAGLIGLGQLIGGASSEEAASTIEQIRNQFIYQPKTQAGQNVSAEVAAPFQQLSEAASSAGQQTLEATGSPAAATAVNTAIEASPLSLGATIRRGGVNSAQRARDVERVEQEAEDIGLDLRQEPSKQREQLQQAAEREAEGISVRGDAFAKEGGDVIGEIRRRRQEEADRVNQLFEEAKSDEALVIQEEASRFIQQASNDIAAEFDVEDMPKVRKRLENFQKEVQESEGGLVDIRDLENIRKRINKNRSSDPSENLALDRLKRQYDDFLQSQFDKGMMLGSEKAIEKWQKARKEHENLRARFDEDKTIAKFINENASPEEAASWVFGTSEAGFPKYSGNVVKRLKNLVGNNSKQFDMLRKEAFFRLADPLLNENPDFRKFANRANKVKKNNPTLVNELFPDGKTSFNKLLQFSKAVEKGTVDPNKIDLNRQLAQWSVGHQIAKGAARQALAERLLRTVRQTKGQSERRKIMGEVLGYDPEAPILPKSPAAITTAVQTSQVLPEKEPSSEEIRRNFQRFAFEGEPREVPENQPTFFR